MDKNAMQNIPDFDLVELWKTQSGETFTNLQLAEYRARKDKDSDPSSGGYPVGPSRVGFGYRQKSTGLIFLITPVRIGDERARNEIEEDKRYLNGINLK